MKRTNKFRLRKCILQQWCVDIPFGAFPEIYASGWLDVGLDSQKLKNIQLTT